MNREEPSGNDAESLDRLVAIDRTCDEFERVWKQPGVARPVIENILQSADAAWRKELLGSLLATEIECRRDAGERPFIAEYRLRFPGDTTIVEQAFAESAVPSKPSSTSIKTDEASNTARNLLFGLLSLQNSFIDQKALLAAFGMWIADKSQSLGDILRAQGSLDPTRRALMSALVTEHLKVHDEDPERSLAELELSDSTRNSLRSIQDSDIERSLAGVSSTATIQRGHESPFARGSGKGSIGGQERRFSVIRPHAEGGLGAVFVALDHELNREVAFKQILDRHAHNEGNRARFLMEAEITGRLEHPGIVPVYGLGINRDGHPYYAMRFIHGDSLKEAIAAFYRDAALQADPGRTSLEFRKLLRAFLDVCNAVAYAHSRGVIHRDIKPANVIVGRYGETLVVDWGLAKAMGSREPGSDVMEATLTPLSGGGSMETVPGSVMGTPAFMSPEQAAGEIERLGPRSDVYGLGATLYCLLTGTAPFKRSEADVDALLVAVTQGAFPPPRQVKPYTDIALEAICLKAMAKRPEDRYPSPRDLADDVERWIADEPVSAYREGWRTRVARWARRHRTLVRAGAASLAVLLAMSIALAVLQTLSTEREKLARNLAEGRLKQVEKANALLVDVFRDIDPRGEEADRQSLTNILSDRLKRAASDLEGQEIADPLTVAKIQIALGTTLQHLGHPADALVLYDKALNTRTKVSGLSDEATLDASSHRAEAYYETGSMDHALALAQETLKTQVARLGLTHAETLQTRNLIANILDAQGRSFEAAAMAEENLKLQTAAFGPTNPHTLVMRQNLGHFYSKSDRDAEAIPILEETAKLQASLFGANHPDTLTTRNNLASCFRKTGKTADALKLYEEILPLRTEKLGASNGFTLVTREGLARCLCDLKRMPEAEAMEQETLRLRILAQGEDHPNTLRSRGNLASYIYRNGRTLDAIAMEQETLKLKLAKLGPNHPDASLSHGNLGYYLLQAGRPREAIPLLEERVKFLIARKGPEHEDTLDEREAVARAYSSDGQHARAIALETEVIGITAKTMGPDHKATMNRRTKLAEVLAVAGRIDESIATRRESLRMLTAKRGRNAPETNQARLDLSGALVYSGHKAETVPLFEEKLKADIAELGPDHPDTMRTRILVAHAQWTKGDRARALATMEETKRLADAKPGMDATFLTMLHDNLVECYETVGPWSKAEPLRRKRVEQLRATEPSNSVNTAGELAMLAQLLLKQGKWQEAEAATRECLAIRERTIPNDWPTFNSMSLLAEALMGMRLHAEAEPWAIRGYEGLKARERSLPVLAKPRLAESADRVIRLYEAWGKPAQAAQWKAKLGLADLPEHVFAP